MNLDKLRDIVFKALRPAGFVAILLSILSSAEINARENTSPAYEIISGECVDYVMTRQAAITVHSVETSCVYYEVENRNTLSEILSEGLGLTGIYGKEGWIERVIALNPELKKRNGDRIVPGQILKMPLSVEAEVTVVSSSSSLKHHYEPKNPFKIGLSTGFTSIETKNGYNDTISKFEVTLAQDFSIDETTNGSLYYSSERIEFGYDKAFGLSPEVFYNQTIGLSFQKRYGAYSLLSDSKVFQLQSLHVENNKAKMRQNLVFSQSFHAGITKDLPGNMELSFKAGPNITNTRSFKSLNPMIGAGASIDLENDQRIISINHNQHRFEGQNSQSTAISITWKID